MRKALPHRNIEKILLRSKVIWMNHLLAFRYVNSIDGFKLQTSHFFLRNEPKKISIHPFHIGSDPFNQLTRINLALTTEQNYTKKRTIRTV